MTTIVDIIGREILDSRGNPTVEVDVILDDGTIGRAAVPSRRPHRRARGGRTARRRQEALPRQGRAARRSKNVNDEIAPQSLSGRDASGPGRDRPAHDRARRHAEQEASSAPTPSSASRWPCAQAAADVLGLPLYRYLGGTNARMLPVPMMNIINGGAHADNPSISRNS